MNRREFSARGHPVSPPCALRVILSFSVVAWNGASGAEMDAAAENVAQSGTLLGGIQEASMKVPSFRSRRPCDLDFLGRLR